MIKLYDKDMGFIRTITKYNNLKITDSLEKGYKIAQFSMPYEKNKLQTEQKVIINNYCYVIKEINMKNNIYYDVYCRPYFGDLTNKYIVSYHPAMSAFEDYMIYILGTTEWDYDIRHKVAGLLSLSLTNCTYFDAIELVCDAFGVEVYYDTYNKKILINPYQDNIEIKTIPIYACECQTNTYDMITRIIPVGKNELTIASINNGSVYLENYDYTPELIVGYYVNDSITNASDLLTIAQQKLSKLSYPHTSYIVRGIITNDLQLGDNIRITDSIKEIDTVQRINKMIIYPDQQEKSTIELGEPKIMFSYIYNQNNFNQNYINNSIYANIANMA